MWLFPNREAIGEQLSFAVAGDRPRQYTVIGVSADLVGSQLETTKPQLFVALTQNATSHVVVLARNSSPSITAEAMTPVFEQALSDFALDPGVVRSSIDTADHRVRSNRTEFLIGSLAAGIGGGVALLLAALGVFGVVGFMVATRTREIGVRMALGASGARVLADVLIDAVKLVVPGVTGGLLLAVPIVREFSWCALGFVEPIVYLVAAAIAFCGALLAALPAARRAAAIDPMSAMRSE
jgi:ABC-type antimicrobial peptide transport system permease subunit